MGNKTLDVKSVKDAKLKKYSLFMDAQPCGFIKSNAPEQYAKDMYPEGYKINVDHFNKIVHVTAPPLTDLLKLLKDV